MTDKQKTLILIDAHALIHRAYHALPPLTTKKGELVNAVFGFSNILLKVLRELKPDYILAAFDLPEPTFRHIEYKEYKATRVKAPDELYAQIGRVKEVLDAFGIPVYEKSGFEADDILGTITQMLNAGHYALNAIIITGDLDTLQLVDENTVVHTLKKGVSDIAVYDRKAVIERFGFEPGKMTDFKGLKGDPSDNIPGVKGVGEKTASELIKKFGNLENLYKALEEKPAKEIGITEGVFKKLTADKDAAFFSKKLATIDRNVPIEFNLSGCETEKFDKNKAVKLFEELGFYTLVKRLQSPSVIPTGDVPQGQRSPEGGQNDEVKIKIEKISEKDDLKKLKMFYAATEKEKCLAIGITESSGDLFSEPKLNIAASKDVIFEIPVSLLKEEKKLIEILEDEEIKKVGHNLKTTLKILRKSGVELKGLYFDVMLAAYLLNPGERDYSSRKIVFSELSAELKNGASDLIFLFDLKGKLSEKMVKSGLWKVFSEIEMPLISILARMEENGFKIDSRSLKESAKEVGEEIQKLEKEIYKLSGTEFNISSPKQLSVVLFEKLEIGTKGMRKTAGGGAISTQASELEKLRGKHKVIDFILKYRELAKLKTTYLDALPALADANGKIHTTFDQTITATGRLSSRDPNLQNIPAGGDWAKKIRSAFLAQDGFVLAAFDYSQVELRIAAALSGDKKMIKAFADGKDIHTLTASEINNVSEENVTPEMRRQAKTLNFGVLYGMAAKSFSETAGLSAAEARNFIDEYFSDFSGLAKFLEEIKERARADGFVSTLTGRLRYLPEINLSNWQLRQAAERMAINMPIQGLAADIVKMAMVEISKQGILSDDCRLLLQVHDELIFEIKEKNAEETGKKIKTAMEKVFALPNGVPLVASAAFGKNWSEC